MNDHILQPGNYSIFVLCDDNTWEQPIYRVLTPISEHDFRILAENDCGGFVSYGVQEDTEAPADCVRVLPVEPKSAMRQTSDAVARLSMNPAPLLRLLDIPTDTTNKGLRHAVAMMIDAGARFTSNEENDL